MNAPSSLHDRVILVTGGTGRLGTAVTKTLLDRGVRVIVTYTQEKEWDRLQSLVSTEVRSQLSGHLVDVTNEAAVNAVVADCLRDHHRIDGVASLVGGWQSKPFVELTLEDWQRQFDLNLTSTFLVMKAVVPTMITSGYGRLVAVGAQSAIQAAAGQAHYNSSKVGVMWLMETISHEVAAYGITANTILPSAIKTAEEHAADPHGVWVSPESVAELVAYLLSPESGATSGAKIPVYGQK
jgi:NAD(P)-dependent dehydrogenase (short-subunit alcohol dehydrogenase family)